MATEPQTPRAPWTPPLLAVLGLAIVVLATGQALFAGTTGEGREWRLYMLLGTAFPAALIGGGLYARTAPSATLERLTAAFIGFGALAALVYTVHAPHLTALCLAVGLAVAAAYADRTTTARGVLLGVTLLGAAHAIFQVGWFRMGHLDHPAEKLWGALLLAALAMAIGVSMYSGREIRQRWQVWALAAAPVVLLVLAALRLPRFSFGDGNLMFHHWGVITGPAGLARGGGLLLHEVPAQYGPLSTLTLAWFPGVSVWEALRLVNATAVLGSALFVFGVVWAARRTVMGLVLATGLAIAAVFVFPGWPFEGPNAFPSAGAYRFWVVYALLGAVLWESRIEATSPPAARNSLVVGTVVWLVAVAWSAESAVYATATWMPALAWSRYSRALRAAPHDGPAGAATAALGALAVPFAALAGVAILVSAWYRQVHHLSPDFGAYLEYARSYSEGFGALEIEPFGAGAALLMMLVVLSTALVSAFSDRDATDRQVVSLAAWGAVWSVASYFVSRSHPQNALALSPMVLAAFATLWFSWARAGVPLPSDVRWVSAGWMAVLLFDAAIVPRELEPLARALVDDPAASVLSRLPPPPQDLIDVMREARVRPNDHIVYLDSDLLVPFEVDDGALAIHADFTARGGWPFTPTVMSRPLTDERGAEYVKRYAKRHPFGGWVLSREPLAAGPEAMKSKALMDRHYKKGPVYRKGEWRLEWRKPIGAKPRGAADPTWPGKTLIPSLESPGSEPERPADGP